MVELAKRSARHAEARIHKVSTTMHETSGKLTACTVTSMWVGVLALFLLKQDQAKADKLACLPMVEKVWWPFSVCSA